MAKKQIYVMAGIIVSLLGALLLFYGCAGLNVQIGTPPKACTADREGWYLCSADELSILQCSSTGVWVGVSNCGAMGKVCDISKEFNVISKEFNAIPDSPGCIFPPCIDPDSDEPGYGNYLGIYTKTAANRTDISKEDLCVDSKTLSEAYCPTIEFGVQYSPADFEPSTNNVACPNGCVDGACITLQPVTESSSDTTRYSAFNDKVITTLPSCTGEGFSPLLKEPVSIVAGAVPTETSFSSLIGTTTEDACTAGFYQYVDEYYCDSNGYPHSVLVECRGRCEDGVCCTQGLTQFHRLLNTANGDHIYTTNGAEKDSIAATPGMQYEGYEGYIYGYQVADTIPLYRYINAARTSQFYTTLEIEKILYDSDPSWTFEGIAGFIYPLVPGRPGTTALYRIRSGNLWLLTTSFDEMESLMESGWTTLTQVAIGNVPINCVDKAPCIDPDGDGGYYTKSTALGNFNMEVYQRMTDYCDSSTHLTERACYQPTEQITQYGVTCPNGCVDGACNP